MTTRKSRNVKTENKESLIEKSSLDIEKVIEEPVEEVEEVEKKPKTKKKVHGIVNNCLRLNIRKEPEPDADVITKVDALTEFVIDESGSTEEWYKVSNSAGIKGYGMKKFIAIKE